MARKYSYKPGFYGWAMERCEEKMLIAGFAEIDARIPPEQQWRSDFLDHFFNHGNGVTFETIAFINAQRRRLNLDPLEYRETTVYEYARSPDRVHKSRLRRQLKAEYEALDTAGKIRWWDEAEVEVARLLPPHLTHEEWLERRKRQPFSHLSTRERAIRAEAFETSEQPATMPPEAIQAPSSQSMDAIAFAVRRLRLARKAETVSAIVSALRPDDALVVAECGELSDPDLIDALVLGSMEAA